MPIDLTDADRAAILEASGYTSLTRHGADQFGAIYRAGLAAGRARGIEEAAQACNDLRWDHNGHPLASDEVSAEECAAAIRALINTTSTKGVK